MDQEKKPETSPVTTTGDAQDVILNWAAASSDTDEKLRFLKRFLNTLSVRELQSASLINQHAKRRKQKDSGKHVAAAAAATVEAPDLSVSPVVEAKPNSWWHSWEANNWQDVYSIDIEKVALVQSKRNVAATISVCNFKGDIIKEWTVEHKPGSFFVNHITLAINGFKSHSLSHGKKLEDVRIELLKFMNDKLWVMVAACGDFDCLGLKSSDFDYFDLQQHFWSYIDDSVGRPTVTPHSLESIYQHFFNCPLQIGAHNANADAVATMKIFRDVYLKEKVTNMTSKYGNEPYEEIRRVKKKKFN